MEQEEIEELILDYTFVNIHDELCGVKGVAEYIASRFKDLETQISLLEKELNFLESERND